MKLKDFDKVMRTYEESIDQYIMPGMFTVARLDGRNFTKLTKETCKFEAPFDDRFRDAMIKTTKALMNCGFKVIYGYTQSDEISLLFSPEETAFAGKIRKYNSLLAGEASATLSMILGTKAVFDCRIIPLPNIELVKDYFIWRQEDASRNALNSTAYWMLRKDGMSVSDASKYLIGMKASDKNELLWSRFNINYNDILIWKKRGIGLYTQESERVSVNMLTKEEVTTKRNSIFVDLLLPMADEYRGMIGGFLGKKKSICMSCESYNMGFTDGLIQGKRELLKMV